jgi:hypothetical protein
MVLTATVMVVVAAAIVVMVVIIVLMIMMVMLLVLLLLLSPAFAARLPAISPWHLPRLSCRPLASLSSCLTDQTA